MLCIHDFEIGLEEYAGEGKKNEFPVFNHCPCCNCISQGNLHRNGYYWRYGINEEDEAFHIPICRLRCLACKTNISILPSFLIPYYQHTLYTIVDRVRQFLEGKKVSGYRQQLAQHVRRFCGGIHWIHSFFVDLGHQLGLSKNIKKEAQKYMKMIRDIGVSPFYRRSWGHLSSYFMGKLISPYLGHEKNYNSPT
ncbi:DUF6431 domain-containing protein [Aquibacillus salsiterrae]|uniref:DUF6431 domain-containing protein n=1 Tax=Aquibacillus salsiterrae TaxID=2950439 RepID=A0A9X4AG48_9BACI|nr:DUF6431 domain-containing protein [Aquibacillus salsiterrae]MDC3418687.1 DUF6431 domain-containing protein [Aquibacillus salsiterrae]